MNQVRRWWRILFLSLLLLSVLVPIVFLSNRLKSITSVDRGEFSEELSNIDGEDFKEPKRILPDREFNSVGSSSSLDKNNDTMQSNEGDKTAVLSKIGGESDHKTKKEQAVIHSLQIHKVNTLVSYKNDE